MITQVGQSSCQHNMQCNTYNILGCSSAAARRTHSHPFFSFFFPHNRVHCPRLQTGTWYSGTYTDTDVHSRTHARSYSLTKTLTLTLAHKPHTLTYRCPRHRCVAVPNSLGTIVVLLIIIVLLMDVCYLASPSPLQSDC